MDLTSALTAFLMKILSSFFVEIPWHIYPYKELITWIEEPMSIHHKFEETYIRLDSKQTKVKWISLSFFLHFMQSELVVSFFLHVSISSCKRKLKTFSVGLEHWGVLNWISLLTSRFLLLLEAILLCPWLCTKSALLPYSSSIFPPLQQNED